MFKQVPDPTGNIKVSNMKKCPFCAEEIQDEAIKCKHCGSDLFTKSSKSDPIKTDVGQMIKRNQQQALWFIVVPAVCAVFLLIIYSMGK